MQLQSVINGVFCYGEMEDDSNFSLVCEEEEFDTVWTDGNTDTNKPFENWSEAVHFLSGIFPGLVEISAC